MSINPLVINLDIRFKITTKTINTTAIAVAESKFDASLISQNILVVKVAPEAPLPTRAFGIWAMVPAVHISAADSPTILPISLLLQVLKNLPYMNLELL